MHRGFDTLRLSIKASIPPDLLETLEAEQRRAELENAPALVEYNGLQFHVKSHGGHGYAFILSGGPDGANWSLKRPNPRDPWGVQIAIGSRFLAYHGLGMAKAHIEHWMERFGMRYATEDVSIARLDYCVDLLAPDFTLIPDQFVMHASTRRRDYTTDDPKVTYGRSGRATSVTVGSTPNRQVIIYDKRAEVIRHGKAHWWDIWNHTRAASLTSETVGPLARLAMASKAGVGSGFTPLSPDPAVAASNRVWRVELRAGKKLLKDRWNIHTWAQLFDRFGEVMREAGKVIRYCEPSGDSNRGRWRNHPLWEAAIAEVEDDLFELRSGADPNAAKEVHKADHAALLLRNLTGTAISRAVMEGVERVEDLEAAMDRLAAEIKHAIARDPERAARSLQAAHERYVFVT
ncbi:hypothetical protein ACS3SW_02125 [Roseobacteraceae bacterium S113]